MTYQGYSTMQIKIKCLKKKKYLSRYLHFDGPCSLNTMHFFQNGRCRFCVCLFLDRIEFGQNMEKYSPVIEPKTIFFHSIHRLIWQYFRPLKFAVQIALNAIWLKHVFRNTSIVSITVLPIKCSNKLRRIYFFRSILNFPKLIYSKLTNMESIFYGINGMFSRENSMPVKLTQHYQAEAGKERKMRAINDHPKKNTAITTDTKR